MNIIPITINELLKDKLLLLEKALDSDIIAIKSPIREGLDNLTLNAIELLKANSTKEKLSVFLTTTGGTVEISERLVYIFRKHYSTVDFIVPDYAYSAGTILCMSGDDILMDYYSVLGPIDPQVMNRDNRFVPALGYLEKINDLIALARQGEISQAEFLILKDFDLAELKRYEQARDLSISLLKEWLVKYKFKNWNTTETKKDTVTEEMKVQRAEDIARKLSDHNRWLTHGRPLNIDKLNNLGLIINDFSDDKELRMLIRDFHNMMIENMRASGMEFQVITKEHL